MRSVDAAASMLLGQCWLRVQLTEDGVWFATVAKLVWPVGDVTGRVHVLPPVGIVAGAESLLRVTIGITSTAPQDGCRAEVKVYTHDARRDR